MKLSSKKFIEKPTKFSFANRISLQFSCCSLADTKQAPVTKKINQVLFFWGGDKAIHKWSATPMSYIPTAYSNRVVPDIRLAGYPAFLYLVSGQISGFICQISECPDYQIYGLNVEQMMRTSNSNFFQNLFTK